MFSQNAGSDNEDGMTLRRRHSLTKAMKLDKYPELQRQSPQKNAHFLTDKHGREHSPIYRKSDNKTNNDNHQSFEPDTVAAF